MASGTREKMVDSAARSLRTNGVRGTSFARVLADSGAPRGSIAHHFPGGKTELILAAVTAAGAEISARLSRLQQAGASGSELVAAICDYFSAGLERTGFRAGCPVAAVANEAFDDPPLRAAADDAMRQWTGTVAQVLRSQGREAPEAHDLAQFCVAAIEGAIMMARVQQSRGPLLVARRQLGILLARAAQS